MKIALVVASARPREQVVVVAAGATVADVLAASGVVPATGSGLSVYGRPVDAATVLSEGDRLEVCPPLEQTPTAARRARMD